MGPCPLCYGPLVWRHNGAWCDRCRVKAETCCEGAPCAPIDATAPPAAASLSAPHPA